MIGFRLFVNVGTGGRKVLARYCILPLLLWCTMVAVSWWTSLQNLERSKLNVASTQGCEVGDQVRFLGGDWI